MIVSKSSMLIEYKPMNSTTFSTASSWQVSPSKDVSSAIGANINLKQIINRETKLRPLIDSSKVQSTASK